MKYPLKKRLMEFLSVGGVILAVGGASAESASNVAPSEAAVDLTPSQINAVKIEPLTNRPFALRKQAVGSIDFDQNLSVQVFPPYPGKILNAAAQLGEPVQKGQALYTVDSPDLLAAESTLIGDAATLALTQKELARAKDLFATNVGVSQREMEQATADHQTAAGAYQAAREALRIFGKTDAEIEQIAASRKGDPTLTVRSPISGEVTAMNAPPGLFVQPGNAPAPYSVADLSVKWMIAAVIENDSPLYHAGQLTKVTVDALPGRVFDGKISKVYPNIDPNTHRMTVRCEVTDTNHELTPGMLANFSTQVQEPVSNVAIPVNGVARNGDGTWAAWVTTDRHHFVQRLVKLGLTQDGQYQILDGLRAGELAVTDGAIFLNNILEAPPSD